LLLLLFVVHLFASLSAPLQGGAAAADPRFYAVSYVEVEASSQARTAAVTALRRYQSTSRSQDGFLAMEAFEQAGRAGHFAFIETWRDQAAFDRRDQSAQTQLLEALQPIRISDIDRRPYKTLTTVPAGAAPAGTVYVITHVDASPTPQLPMLLQQLAADSRRDTGNLRFDIVQHTMRANHFTIVEAWRDRKALDDHAAAPHTRQYREAFGPMAGSPLDERVFEAVGL
jgi:quinol monooxygenase YgiN